MSVTFSKVACQGGEFFAPDRRVDVFHDGLEVGYLHRDSDMSGWAASTDLEYHFERTFSDGDSLNVLKAEIREAEKEETEAFRK